MNDAKRIEALTIAADQADKSRAEATALLAAVIRKFGGAIYLTRAEMNNVTIHDAVVKDQDASGAILLRVGHAPQDGYNRHLASRIMEGKS